MKISLKNVHTGLVKEVKVGFSWTAFFFGMLVPLIRGDMKNALRMLLLGIITLGISWLVFPFVYNKMYIKTLIEKGYKPIDSSSENTLKNLGMNFA